MFCELDVACEATRGGGPHVRGLPVPLRVDAGPGSGGGWGEGLPWHGCEVLGPSWGCEGPWGRGSVSLCTLHQHQQGNKGGGTKFEESLFYH